jgi:cytochrome c peroxidase
MRFTTPFCAALLFSGVLFAALPLGLPPVPIPQDNPQSPAKIALGRLLFNDRRFSADGTISCSSCHRPELAFTDGLPVAQGIRGIEGTRNSPTVINAAYYTSLFLDGRRDSLETQALDPLVNSIEHGLSDHQLVVDVVCKDPDYPARFQAVFDVAADQITIDHVVKAIASYERTLISGDSPFDRYFFGGDRTAMSESAARGLNLFRRKGNCANCHEISWNNALFTDNRFYNIGVGYDRLEPSIDAYLEGLQQSAKASTKPGATSLTDVQRSELGQFNITRVVSDIGKFRTPTLRNIGETGPYMHDGSLKTLEEVVEYYDKGGKKNPYLDAAIFPLKLTEQEKSDLIAFLKSLTGK